MREPSEKAPGQQVLRYETYRNVLQWGFRLSSRVESDRTANGSGATNTCPQITDDPRMTLAESVLNQEKYGRVLCGNYYHFFSLIL